MIISVAKHFKEAYSLELYLNGEKYDGPVEALNTETGEASVFTVIRGTGRCFEAAPDPESPTGYKMETVVGKWTFRIRPGFIPKGQTEEQTIQAIMAEIASKQ